MDEALLIRKLLISISVTSFSTTKTAFTLVIKYFRIFHFFVKYPELDQPQQVKRREKKKVQNVYRWLFAPMLTKTFVKIA